MIIILFLFVVTESETIWCRDCRGGVYFPGYLDKSETTRSNGEQIYPMCDFVIYLNFLSRLQDKNK